MKKTIVLISALVLAAVAIFFACEQQNDRPETANYLAKGSELAQQLGGFYFKNGHVAVVKDIDNGQERLQLTLTNGGIKPHTVNIFLEKKEWNDLKIQSSEYEVLYLKQILILNEPRTGNRYTFKVQSEGLKELEVKLPENYLSNQAIEAIGIAFRGPLPSLKGNPEFLTEQCHSAGGPGTLSCSNACCTVTCKNGYYASCGQSCNCTKED
ncbi:hypothetical protein SAMN05216327_114185 [Dyadobacter sp. SG02]|uniref:hypothetical protein n=1 Tax=Dyadobacter sp. SG02 TaxID=1855291 RepID=UPI0008BA1FDB|nr:hypothetical protein [Dyadobacter sp. SG02]SEJ63225.1 hypothetical protein SAMN05216327_114185 [Dyadobacter sp. SG02]